MPSSAPSLQLTLPRVSEGWWPPGGLVQAPLTWYCEASPTFRPWSRLRAGCPGYRWPGPATLRGCGDLRGPGPGRGAAAPSSSPHPRTCGLTLTIWSASRPGIGQGSSNFFTLQPLDGIFLCVVFYYFRWMQPLSLTIVYQDQHVPTLQRRLQDNAGVLVSLCLLWWYRQARSCTHCLHTSAFTN